MTNVRRVLLPALLAPLPALAAFEDAGFGPRDVAMGGAFTAVVDDPGVVAYNPAALGQASSLEVAASYLRQFHIPSGETDRDQSRAAVIVPVRQRLFNGGFGFDVRHDRRAGVAVGRSIALLYGTRGLRETQRGGLDFGAGLKILSTALEAGGTLGPAAALDLGTLWRYSPRGALGASLLNFGGAGFRSGSFVDRAPLALKLGVSEQLRGAIIAVDATKREPSKDLPGTFSFAAGFERWWSTARAGQYALRSGLSLGDKSRTWSWGLGWRSQGARLDYAMIVPMTGIARFGHGLSLTLRFGRADPEAEYEKLLAVELAQRRRLRESLEAGAVKQWKLAEELSGLREEIAALRLEVDQKRASESEARRRLQELERRRRDAAAEHERLKATHAETALKARESLFGEDWRAYERAKLAGAADAALLERVKRLLHEYKDSGVDLGAAHRELLRLERGRIP